MRHAYVDAWTAGTGLCAPSRKGKPAEALRDGPGQFVGWVYVSGDGALCTMCRRAMGRDASDVQRFLDNDEQEGGR